MIYKAVLVDDEPNAIMALQYLLKDYSNIEIVATANSFSTAIKAIQLNSPDLLFLDIEMPGKGGFDIVRELQQKDESNCCDIIFTTAHEDHAIKAIKHAAFDFLLKPIDPDELSETIKRYLINRGKISLEKKLDNLLYHINNGSKKIKFNTGTGYVLLNPEDIILCKAEGNYTSIHDVRDKRYFVTVNLGKLEKILPPNHFFRVSRSAIVNLSCISRVDRKTATCELIKDGISFTVKVPSKQLKRLEEL